jgi:hypothetical protein
MKLEDVKFWNCAGTDFTNLVKYLENEFPTAIVTPIGGDIEVMESNEKKWCKSPTDWIITMAYYYQVEDVFHLFFWQSNSPVDDLIEGTKEYKEQEEDVEIDFDKEEED